MMHAVKHKNMMHMLRKIVCCRRDMMPHCKHDDYDNLLSLSLFLSGWFSSYVIWCEWCWTFSVHVRFVSLTWMRWFPGWLGRTCVTPRWLAHYSLAQRQIVVVWWGTQTMFVASRPSSRRYSINDNDARFCPSGRHHMCKLCVCVCVCVFVHAFCAWYESKRTEKLPSMRSCMLWCARVACQVQHIHIVHTRSRRVFWSRAREYFCLTCAHILSQSVHAMTSPLL